MADTPRILIVTAAFGEGHNSAARNLALAFDSVGVASLVGDPCMRGAPLMTRWLSMGYRWVTTHWPRVWEWIYRSTDRCDFSGPPKGVMKWPLRAMIEMIREFQPDAVVSTYPLYPYFMPEIERAIGRRLPVFTVVTDSIEINATWLKAPCEGLLVTDPFTVAGLVKAGVPADRLMDTGFPVNPAFATLGTVAVDDACDPFRVLYFPTSKLPMVRRHSRAILDADPRCHLTLVLGKNVRSLYKRAREIKAEYPGRVRLLGWTRKVPSLMSTHHLVVGKAGGATVHEALAARCPMLIHHLVPGQEEGNLQLLELLGCGSLAATPEAIRTSVETMLAGDAARWREMKRSLIQHNRFTGAMQAAQAILWRMQG